MNNWNKYERALKETPIVRLPTMLKKMRFVLLSMVDELKQAMDYPALTKRHAEVVAELIDTRDALHVVLTAAKRDPDAPFDWPDRNDRIGAVLARAVKRVNSQFDGGEEHGRG